MSIKSNGLERKPVARLVKKKTEGLKGEGDIGITSPKQLDVGQLYQAQERVKPTVKSKESAGSLPSVSASVTSSKGLGVKTKGSKRSAGSKGKKVEGPRATRLRDILFQTLEEVKSKKPIDVNRVNSVIRASKEILASVRIEVMANKESEFFKKKE